MKVNRSKLFKNAWKCIRKWHVTLSTALKMAWAMAKKEAQIRSYYGIDECYYFNFNLWDIRDIKCDADLAIWASAAYDGWGAFRYMEIKISEGIPSNDDPNYVVLGENTMRELQHKDNIHRFILNYLEKKYPIFNEDNEDYDDELIDDFYEELCGLFKKDEKFDLYKKNYYYMMLAERMKERIEKILEWETSAYKTEEINQVKVCHNKKLIIPFGVKYKID